MYDALILSGGGAKGFSTLGALQYMQDNKLIDPNIKYLIGTSIGAIISYFLCIGYSPIEMVVYMCSNSVLESLKINNFEGIFKAGGIYSYSIIYNHYEKMTMDKIGYIPTMLDLKEKFGKELVVSTYNLTDDKIEYISYKNYPEISCLDAIRMSSNLPFIFNEFLYNEKEYIDGGVFDNFPIQIIPDNALKPFGIYLDAKKDQINDSAITKFIDKVYKILMIPIKQNEKIKINSLDTTVEILKIPVEKIKIYTFSLQHSQKLELFSIGYNHAKDYFQRISV